MKFPIRAESDMQHIKPILADTRIEADIAGKGAELPVKRSLAKEVRLPGDSALITYRVRLDVPRELSCSFRDSWPGTARRLAPEACP